VKINSSLGRQAISANNLLWSCTFFDELEIRQFGELTYTKYTSLKFPSSAQNLNIKNIDEDIKDTQTFYARREKPVSFYLDPFTNPANLSEELVKREFQEDHSEEEIWWGIGLNQFTNFPQTPGLTINICDTKEKFDDHIKVTLQAYEHFDDWANKLLENFGKNKPGLKVIHYVGYMNNIPVACSTLGIYQKLGILINTAVIPQYRRKGIHTSLMQQRLKDSKQQGAEIAFYQTDYNNEASIATGQKLGFTESFRRKLFYKNL
jgi:GNAT superfamily N-acetyltransferase